MLLLRKTHGFGITEDDAAERSKCLNILFTAFNVPIKDYRDRLARDGVDYNEWLKTKRDAFFSTCFPSVLGQSNKDFIWIIAFGEKTPEVEEILAAIAPHAFIRPVFLNGGGAGYHAPIRAVRAENPSFAFVQTLRLDCDDAINRHYIFNMNAYANALINARTGFSWRNPSTFFRPRTRFPLRRPIALSAPYGAKLAGDQWSPMSWPLSPFISVVERARERLTTVYCSPHGSVYKVLHVRYLHTRQPMWLQVVGIQNVMNRIGHKEQPLSPVTPEFLDLFGVPAPRDQSG